MEKLYLTMYYKCNLRYLLATSGG